MRSLERSVAAPALRLLSFFNYQERSLLARPTIIQNQTFHVVQEREELFQRLISSVRTLPRIAGFRVQGSGPVWLEKGAGSRTFVQLPRLPNAAQQPKQSVCKLQRL